MVLSSGGGLGEGDGESECRELSDVAASSAVGVGAARVVVRAEILIAGGWVGQELPDDDQDGAGDGDEGLELAAAFDDAPVAFAEEGVGAGGRGGGLAQDTFQVGVSLTGAPAAAGGPGLDGARAELGPRHQVTGGGKPAHVQARRFSWARPGYWLVPLTAGSDVSTLKPWRATILATCRR